MGVHGLWEIVGPTARPVRLEGLRNKKLAVDASIWIYQFLKAVRDKEGNQLRNSHIVGFFRRICKLLFFGIKPVFVFDGGVPTLKKETIRKRKQRREDQKETVQQTAHRLLAKQLQKHADNESGINISSKKKSSSTRKEIPIEGLQFNEYFEDNNYFNEQPTNKSPPPARIENESKLFRKQDDYDLPFLKEFRLEKADNRVVTDYEYERLTKDIENELEDVDLDNIDPQSAEFAKLPLSTQYIALSHLRLRSRLRMGYSKSQLESLFPNSMEFSKFQIRMVQKRNYLTQKLMNMTGMDDEGEDIIARRIASDKNRAYSLKRTDGGYALSITKENENHGSDLMNPIHLDDVDEIEERSFGSPEKITDDENDDSLEWEDISIDQTPAASAKKAKPGIPKTKSMLFIEDTESSASDEEEIEMEEVPTSRNYDENDEVMAKIKSLYELAEKNNKKTKNGDEFEVDVDYYQEAQIEQLEQEDLRQAVEKSKKDYLMMLSKENDKDFSISDSLDDDAPIILTKSTLSNTLKIPNFSMKNNLLFGGTVSDSKNTTELHDVKEKKPESKNKVLSLPNWFAPSASDSTVSNNHKNVDVLKVAEKKKNPESKNKVLPLPNWFATSASDPTASNNHNGIGVLKVAEKNLTEDEQAGLISYRDLGNYLTSGDKTQQEFIDDENESDLEITAVHNKNIKENPSSIRAYEARIEEDERTEDKNKKDAKNKFEESLKYAVDTGKFKPNDFPSGKEIQKTKYEEIDVDSDLDDIDFEDIEKVSDEVEQQSLEPKYTDIGKLLTGKQSEEKTMLIEDYEFSDEDQERLFVGMEEEDKAYNAFVNKVKSNNLGMINKSSKWTIEDEVTLQERLNKQKRDSDEVTTGMILDVQELLSRFGIPFITAPMEAEAQCAELKLLKLVDGIVTDDSDCFLFGGDKIYKNLFNEKNFVECYQEDDIEHSLGLNRETMIELAILLGSDYTEGLKGVGKVTAMEILAEFKSLKNFKEWWLEYQTGIIDKDKDTPIRKKLRKSLGKNLFLNNNFPNRLIFEAYLHPEVDHDNTQFKWGYPNLDKLRTFLMINVHWPRSKVDEILLPVIQSMNKPQSTIEEFFPVEMIQRRKDILMGKRIKDATEKLRSGRKRESEGGNSNKTKQAKKS